MDNFARDPVLMQFRAALDEAFGDRIEQVLLFGSRARGDARADSDYDFAMFLRDLRADRADSHLLADLRTRFFDQDAFFDAFAFQAAKLVDPASPLMFEIRRDGIAL